MQDRSKAPWISCAITESLQGANNAAKGKQASPGTCDWPTGDNISYHESVWIASAVSYHGVKGLSVAEVYPVNIPLHVGRLKSMVDQTTP